jgi:pepF/M3 family oligoendopeptidase
MTDTLDQDHTLDHASERPTRWDLSNVYSGLEGDDYRAEFARLSGELDDLEHFFATHGVKRLAHRPAPDDVLADVLEQAVRRASSIAERLDTLEAFVYAAVSTDSYNDVAAREMSKVDRIGARWKQLSVRAKGWIGSLDGVLPELIVRSPFLKDHAFFLTDTARQSRYLMSDELESLAAELCLDAGVAFGKLQGNATCQLKVPFERDGKTEPLPITVVQNLRFDADPAVRERAHRAEIEAWRSIHTTVAACLNGVKGTAVTLARRRGRASVLDVALDQNKIDRATLDAMLGAIREAFPMFRGYMASKARKLGKDRLAWWDLFAPVGSAHSTFTWKQARDFLVEKFAAFDGQLSDMAVRAFDRRWIDGEPRDGKRVGAFCMAVQRTEESRILANFDGSFEQVGTLAHELGHAFHNDCQRGLEPLRRGAPSTLAETASIFCETLVAEAALPHATRDEQSMILEAQLCGAAQVCLDITSRYQFESEVIARRAECELSAEELCQLMLAAQRDTYADAVDPDTYHRYMWLWKPHYYAYDANFYNFPYAFGHLFALGLYAIYRREGAAFVPRYKELLRETAQSEAAPLAARFGIDIQQPDFWRGSLAIIADQARRYDAL